MNAKIVNETDNEVIVDNFTGNSNIDISKYKGKRSSLCYNCNNSL